MCGLGGVCDTARLIKQDASNNCVQRSAAGESHVVTSMLHAAPADAKR